MGLIRLKEIIANGWGLYLAIESVTFISRVSNGICPLTFTPEIDKGQVGEECESEIGSLISFVSVGRETSGRTHL